MSNSEPLPPVSTVNGRTHDGRFSKGNTFAAGNPILRKIRALRAQLVQSIDREAMQRIIRKLIEMAEQGDLEAIKVLFNYSIGRPSQTFEPLSFLSAQDIRSMTDEELEAMRSAIMRRRNRGGSQTAGPGAARCALDHRDD
jgi:hypothetical protein